MQEYLNTYISKARKIRRITTNNKSGDAYGITIPAWVAEVYVDRLFTITVQGQSIILTISGVAVRNV